LIGVGLFVGGVLQELGRGIRGVNAARHIYLKYCTCT